MPVLRLLIGTARSLVVLKHIKHTEQHIPDLIPDLSPPTRIRGVGAKAHEHFGYIPTGGGKDKGRRSSHNEILVGRTDHHPGRSFSEEGNVEVSALALKCMDPSSSCRNSHRSRIAVPELLYRQRPYALRTHVADRLD